MTTDQLEVSFTGPEDLSPHVARYLKGEQYDETEGKGMTGSENELLWIIGAVLGSPIVAKLIDLLKDSLTQAKVGKASLSRNGKVIMEGATPAQIIKVLRELNK